MLAEPPPWKSGPLPKKTAVSGGKTKKKLSKFFLRLWDTYKKYILQKNWVKTAIPALSSGQNNLQTPIWGCHRQLDDQHRNPNMNNKDHIVGQLTSVKEDLWGPLPDVMAHRLLVNFQLWQLTSSCASNYVLSFLHRCL